MKFMFRFFLGSLTLLILRGYHTVAILEGGKVRGEKGDREGQGSAPKEEWMGGASSESHITLRGMCLKYGSSNKRAVIN
ncbi:hypothetical protein ANCCEY_13984 [Ancylostoma ceylanicum]|uniref:Secreted protein n=1 Tax=Ancylostoma ceylanicum TaxID=53326 RepID=A0A0D6LH00_9BILA|nr:hypothetical protein ANCCEY_13984 [Ancylostoma ceylanicum]